jgi:hypothetical protein
MGWGPRGSVYHCIQSEEASLGHQGWETTPGNVKAFGAASCSVAMAEWQQKFDSLEKPAMTFEHLRCSGITGHCNIRVNSKQFMVQGF